MPTPPPQARAASARAQSAQPAARTRPSSRTPFPQLPSRRHRQGSTEPPRPGCPSACARNERGERGERGENDSVGAAVNLEYRRWQPRTATNPALHMRRSALGKYRPPRTQPSRLLCAQIRNEPQPEFHATAVVDPARRPNNATRPSRLHNTISSYYTAFELQYNEKFSGRAPWPAP